MKLTRMSLAAPLTVASLAGCTTPAPGPTTAGSVTYTCCTAKDVETLYRAGEPVMLHWIVKSPDGPSTPSPAVELTAGLTGPYRDIDTLKAAMTKSSGTGGVVTYTASPVRPAGTPDEQPVSVIRIRAEAKPGYYNLRTSVSQDNGTASGGASIIRVLAAS